MLCLQHPKNKKDFETLYLQPKSNSMGGATIQSLSSRRKKQEAGNPGAEQTFEVDGHQTRLFLFSSDRTGRHDFRGEKLRPPKVVATDAMGQVLNIKRRRRAPRGPSDGTSMYLNLHTQTHTHEK